MADRVLQRLLRDERGFTLLELLLVAVILVILASLAVPAGLYYESNSTYAAMTIAKLKTYDSNLTTSGMYVNNSGTEAAGVTRSITMDTSHFCVYATSGRWFAYQLNPTGAITITTVGSAVCT